MATFVSCDCAEACEENKGSAGIDGMTVDELRDHLKMNWPAIKHRVVPGGLRIGVSSSGLGDVQRNRGRGASQLFVAVAAHDHVNDHDQVNDYTFGSALMHELELGGWRECRAHGGTNAKGRIINARGIRRQNDAPLV